jgi:hypothetical protein
MVHSSTLIVSADSERLTCGGFSLSEIVPHGSLEFIADCFCDLSLSPMRNNSGAAFMGSTNNGSSSLLWAMIEDSTEEFYTALSWEGDSDHPSSRRHGMGAPSALVTTTHHG